MEPGDRLIIIRTHPKAVSRALSEIAQPLHRRLRGTHKRRNVLDRERHRAPVAHAAPRCCVDPPSLFARPAGRARSAFGQVPQSARPRAGPPRHRGDAAARVEPVVDAAQHASPRLAAVSRSLSVQIGASVFRRCNAKMSEFSPWKRQYRCGRLTSIGMIEGAVEGSGSGRTCLISSGPPAPPRVVFLNSKSSAKRPLIWLSCAYRPRRSSASPRVRVFARVGQHVLPEDHVAGGALQIGVVVRTGGIHEHLFGRRAVVGVGHADRTQLRHNREFTGAGRVEPDDGNAVGEFGRIGERVMDEHGHPDFALIDTQPHAGLIGVVVVERGKDLADPRKTPRSLASDGSHALGPTVSASMSSRRHPLNES